MWRHRNNQRGIAEHFRFDKCKIIGYLFVKTDAGIAVSWKVVHWPANYLINLSSAEMLTLL